MASHEHLHRRHRRAAEPLAAPEILAAPLEERAQTLVSVVYVTASPTFTGAIGGYSTVGVVASTSNAAPKATTPAVVQSSATAAKVSSSASPIASSIAADVSSAASSSLPTEITAPATSLASSIAVLAATSSLSTSTPNAASATSISAASATSSSDASSSSSGGMSTGGKAGLAIGILLLVGAILAMVLYCFKRRKEAAKQPLADREKQQDPFSDSLARQQSTHSVQSTRSTATAPRLSLRPVTQFIPNLMEKRQSRGNALLNVGAAQNEKAIPMERPITPQADNVANPFGNHAEAIDAQNAKGPSPVTTPVEEVDGAGLARVARGASKRENGPKPLDFTKAGPFMGPPSPAGTEFSTTSDSVSTPTQTTSGAAIAAAGGPANSTVHRVQLDFKPSMDDELELRAGQLIRLLHEYDDGWALCIRLDRSQQGVVPRTCLSVRPVKPRPQQNGPRGSPQGRPMSPASQQGRPMTPNGRPMTPNGQQAGRPNTANSQRPRSPSAAQTQSRRNSPPGPSPMNPVGQAISGPPRSLSGGAPQRKPVPGQAL